MKRLCSLRQALQLVAAAPRAPPPRGLAGRSCIAPLVSLWLPHCRRYLTQELSSPRNLPAAPSAAQPSACAATATAPAAARSTVTGRPAS